MFNVRRSRLPLPRVLLLIALALCSALPLSYASAHSSDIQTDFPNLVTPVAASPQTWTSTGRMVQPRVGHTATLLANGKVLVAGGANTTNNALASAELYDPARGTWTATGRMVQPRTAHTATLLANGKVLVAGGADINGNALASAELYDPVQGTWAATGTMHDAHSGHTATRLTNDTVLVAGGLGDNLPVSPATSAELYHPTTGTWTRTGSLTEARSGHTATLLRTGQVLVAGGFPDFRDTTSDAELYNPTTGTWTRTARMANVRGGHTATLLANGHVLVTGGQYPDIFGDWRAMATAELYDPTHGTWTVTRNMPGARSDHTATLLTNGTVLVVGGSTATGTDFYTPARLTWTPTASLHTARSFHTATLLADGTVLVAGGEDTNYNVLTSAEVYSP